jgi:sugar phosphate isomerase/epimerase
MEAKKAAIEARRIGICTFVPVSKYFCTSIERPAKEQRKAAMEAKKAAIEARRIGFFVSICSLVPSKQVLLYQ